MLPCSQDCLGKQFLQMQTSRSHCNCSSKGNGPTQAGSRTWQHCPLCTSFAGMQDVRLMRSWNFQALESCQGSAIVGRVRLSARRIPEKLLHDILEGKLKLQWGLQDAGETRIRTHLPNKFQARRGADLRQRLWVLRQGYPNP